MLFTPRFLDFVAAGVVIVIGVTARSAITEKTERGMLAAASVPSALLIGMAISADPVGPGVGNASLMSVIGVVLYAVLVVALVLVRLDYKSRGALRVVLVLTPLCAAAMVGLAAYAEPKLPPFRFHEANMPDVNPP